jgi:hypothetical protein
MIRKGGNRFSLATNANGRLRGDHAQSKRLDHDAISSNRIVIQCGASRPSRNLGQAAIAGIG